MLAENEALVRFMQAWILGDVLVCVVLEHVDERLTFVLVGILHELLSNDQTVLYWLEVRGRDLFALISQTGSGHRHEGGILDVVHEVLLLNSEAFVAECSEHERRRNLIEV